MKLKQLRCPNCNAILIPSINDSTITCKHCNSIFTINDKNNKKTSTLIDFNHTYNYNENKKDETEIEKAKYDYKQSKLGIIICLLPLLLLFGVWGIPEIIDKYDSIKNKKYAIEAGLVSVGSSDDLIGEDYKTVKAHFESAGFQNIELIDLNDSKLKFWTKDEVETISIEGKNTFTDEDYFSPDSTVYITYH